MPNWAGKCCHQSIVNCGKAYKLWFSKTKKEKRIFYESVVIFLFFMRLLVPGWIGLLCRQFFSILDILCILLLFCPCPFTLNSKLWKTLMSHGQSTGDCVPPKSCLLYFSWWQQCLQWLRDSFQQNVSFSTSLLDRNTSGSVFLSRESAVPSKLMTEEGGNCAIWTHRKIPWRD